MVLMFETWYRQGKNFAKTMQTLAALNPPLHVKETTIYRYAKVYEWDRRAGERDQIVADELQKKAVEDLTAFHQRTLQTGRLLQSKGLRFINDDTPKLKDPNDPSKGYDEHTGKGGIKNEFAAIQAVKLGLEFERAGMNLPDTRIGVEGAGGGAVIIKVIRERKEIKNLPADETTGTDEDDGE